MGRKSGTSATLDDQSSGCWTALLVASKTPPAQGSGKERARLQLWFSPCLAFLWL